MYCGSGQIAKNQRECETVSEYPISMQVMKGFNHKLQAWLAAALAQGEAQVFDFAYVCMHY